MPIQKETKPEARAHIYEIDLIRAITVFSVVAIHSLSYTNFLTTDPSGIRLLSLIGHTLHYNRAMYIFVTGLVLTYAYFNKPFSTKKFWSKRFLLVFIPYVVWTIVYVFRNHPLLSAQDYVTLTFWDIFTGNASFQLYYILLALQFYALFPLFLTYFRKVVQHPWITLSISFAVQIILVYIDFYYLQTPPLNRAKSVIAFLQFQDRFFLLYQFYFVLGSFTAIYINPIRKFLLSSGWYLSLALIAALVLFSINYYSALNWFHESVGRATSVFQPSVVLYSIVAIIFFVWLAVYWSKTRKGYKLVKIISDTSFGIYFVHVLALSLIKQFLLPKMRGSIPVPVIDISVMLLAFCASALVCYFLLKIPWLSWTIGKASPMKWFSKKQTTA